MKRLLILLYLVLSPFLIFAQKKVTDIAEQDTGWYKLLLPIQKSLPIADLAKSKDGLHWRLWHSKYNSSSAVIDMYSTNSNEYHVSIILYSIEWVDKTKERPTGRVYYKKIELSPTLAAGIHKWQKNLEIRQFTDRDTVGSGTRVYCTQDALPYIGEYADNKYYTLKTSIVPGQTQNIDAFLDSIDRAVHFKKMADEFEKNIPFESYSSIEQFTINTHPGLTHAQKESYLKERNDYRRTKHIE